MPTASDWKRHFAKRFRSLDGHLLLNPNYGPYIGYTHDVVGYLAEVCPDGALELAERILRNTVTVVKPEQVPGGPPAAPIRIPADPVAIRATVERAHEWVQQVRAGKPAGENARLISDEDVRPLLRSGDLVSGCLVWMTPDGAVEGMLAALRPRLMQSQKMSDLRVVAQGVMRQAQSVAPLLHDM